MTDSKLYGVELDDLSGRMARQLYQRSGIAVQGYEKTAFPVNAVSAALILSDKSDVRRSRVRKNAIIATDIHDRVNYAVVNASLKIDKEQKLCLFNITIDTDICPVMEYFEIFLDRMVLCRKAADLLGLTFELIINDTRLL